MKIRDLMNINIKKSEKACVTRYEKEITVEVQGLIITGEPSLLLQFISELNNLGGNK